MYFACKVVIQCLAGMKKPPRYGAVFRCIPWLEPASLFFFVKTVIVITVVPVSAVVVIVPVLSYFVNADIAKAIDFNFNITACNEEVFCIHQFLLSAKESSSHFVHFNSVAVAIEMSYRNPDVVAKIASAINDNFEVVAAEILYRNFRPAVGCH